METMNQPLFCNHCAHPFEGDPTFDGVGGRVCSDQCVRELKMKGRLFENGVAYKPPDTQKPIRPREKKVGKKEILEALGYN